MKKKYKPKFKKKPNQQRTYHMLPVKDATEDHPFAVSQAHKKGAVANDQLRCVVAKANLETDFEGAHPKEVRVHRSIVMVLPSHEKYWVRFLTPGNVRTQLLRFDAGGQFASGDYKLKAVPERVIQSRGKAHSPPDRKRGAPDSPHKRKGAAVFKNGEDHVSKRIAWQDLGREPFSYDRQAA